MTLTEFLLARIAEDEEAARYAYDQGEEYGGDDVEWRWLRLYRRSPKMPHSMVDLEDAWSPERVLAECEAKRRIVELAPWANNGANAALKDLPGRLILRQMAVPYADHPDYREEWRP